MLAQEEKLKEVEELREANKNREIDLPSMSSSDEEYDDEEEEKEHYV